MKQTFDSVKEQIVSKEFYPQGGEGKLAYISLPFSTTMDDQLRYHPVTYQFVMAVIENDLMSLYWSHEGMRAVANHFLTQLREDPHFLDKIKQDWYEVLIPFYAALEAVKQQDFAVLDAKELIALYKDLAQKSYDAWIPVLFIDAFDLDGSQIVGDALKVYDPTLVHQIGFLTSPHEMSYVQQQKLSLLKIAEKVLKENITEETMMKMLLREHQQQFYWYKNNYNNALLLDVDFFLGELQSLLKDSSLQLTTNEIKKIETGFVENNKKRDALLQTLPIDLRALLVFFGELTVLRDKRKK